MNLLKKRLVVGVGNHGAFKMAKGGTEIWSSWRLTTPIRIKRLKVRLKWGLNCIGLLSCLVRNPIPAWRLTMEAADFCVGGRELRDKVI